VRLTAGSDRTTAARRFGLELRRALAARDATIRGFAAEAGIGRTRLQNWIAGTSLPPVQTAERVADLLMWPRLAELARAGRERTCDDCGRSFVVETASPQRYCSPECQRAHNKIAGTSRDLRRAVLERRVRRFTGAVEAMCAACEPSGVCRTPDCPLQVAGVSAHRLEALA
jgi:hypothetical protein